MDELTKFKVEQFEALRAIVRELGQLEKAADVVNEALARGRERLEFYLKSMA